MCALALELIDAVSASYPVLAHAWGNELLKWGSSCTNRHVACRALQLFRALNSPTTPSTIQLLVNGLVPTISHNLPEFQSHSLDILITLTQITRLLNAKNCLESGYTQLFWVSLALLSSIHEWEYFKGLELLGIIMSKIDISQQSTINQLMASIPSRWPGGFSGIFIPLSRGLSSSKTEDLALEILNSLLFISVSVFLDTRPAKYLFIVLANLPKLMRVYEYETGIDSLFERGHSVIEGCMQTAELLASACSQGNCDSLSRLLVSFTNQRIRKRDVFLKQLAAIIKDEFSMSEGQVLKLCLSMVTNSISIYPKCMLELLELLLQDASSQRNISSLPVEPNGAWIRPLLSLLGNRKFYMHASRLLDIIIANRLKATEQELTTSVGGAQNLFAYVQKARDDFVYLESGWLVQDVQSEGSLLAKRRLATIAKSFGEINEKRGEGRDVDRDGVKGLLAQFEELERQIQARR